MRNVVAELNAAYLVSVRPQLGPTARPAFARSFGYGQRQGEDPNIV